MDSVDVHQEFLRKKGWEDFAEGLERLSSEFQPEALELREYFERYLAQNPLTQEAYEFLIAFHLFFENYIFAERLALCFLTILDEKRSFWGKKGEHPVAELRFETLAQIAQEKRLFG